MAVPRQPAYNKGCRLPFDFGENRTMSTLGKKKTVGVKWVDAREFESMVDTRARRVLGISGKKFITRWKNGHYRKLDSDTCPGVIELAILAPLPRHKRGRKNSKRGRR